MWLPPKQACELDADETFAAHWPNQPPEDPLADPALSAQRLHVWLEPLSVSDVHLDAQCVQAPAHGRGEIRLRGGSPNSTAWAFWG